MRDMAVQRQRKVVRVDLTRSGDISAHAGASLIFSCTHHPRRSIHMSWQTKLSAGRGLRKKTIS